MRRREVRPGLASCSLAVDAIQLRRHHFPQWSRMLVSVAGRVRPAPLRSVATNAGHIPPAPDRSPASELLEPTSFSDRGPSEIRRPCFKGGTHVKSSKRAGAGSAKSARPLAFRLRHGGMLQVALMLVDLGASHKASSVRCSLDPSVRRSVYCPDTRARPLLVPSHELRHKMLGMDSGSGLSKQSGC